MEKFDIAVEGMMCKMCAKHVEEAALSVDGVKKAKVSLEDKKVTVTADENVDKAAIVAKINQAGYKA